VSHEVRDICPCRLVLSGRMLLVSESLLGMASSRH
jgi:hypothetical protein